jgi:glycosyltransferase involved in cell wall biosynthesis
VTRSPRPSIFFVASIGETLRYFVAPLAEYVQRCGFDTVGIASGVGEIGGFTHTVELPAYRRRGAHSTLRAYMALNEAILTRRPCLLHLHTPPALAIGRIAGLRTRTPTLAVAHGSFLGTRDRRGLMYVTAESSLAWLSRRTVTENAEDAQFYGRFARPRSVDVAPVGGLGLDLARLRRACLNPKRLAAAPCVVVVGRLTPDKNGDLAVEAYSLLRSRFPGASLVFIGQALPGERAWRVPHMPGISHVAWVEDVYPYLAGADALLSASKREGFSMAVAEALAIGTPAVAVSNRGSREVRRQVATELFRLVPPDPAAIADGLAAVLGDRLREEDQADLKNMWSADVAIAFHAEAIGRVLGRAMEPMQGDAVSARAAPR